MQSYFSKNSAFSLSYSSHKIHLRYENARALVSKRFLKKLTDFHETWREPHVSTDHLAFVK
jgi:hypothetical protein